MNYDWDVIRDTLIGLAVIVAITFALAGAVTLGVGLGLLWLGVL